MKVVPLPPPAKYPAPRFKNLEPGDTFKYPSHNACVLMKLDTGLLNPIITNVEGDRSRANCVFVTSGELFNVPEDGIITRVYGSFIEEDPHGKTTKEKS